MPKQLRYLLAAYWVGLPVGLLIALSGASYGMVISKLIPDLSTHLLPYSVVHMFVLVVLGAMTPQPDHELAGSKIQTAGYLYTLIAFSSAFFQLGAGNLTVSSLMIPAGSALITSIIGWFAGGEISARGWLNQQRELGSEVARVAAELSGFSVAVRQIHVQYIETISAASKEYKELHSKQAAMLKKAAEMAASIAATVTQISATTSKLENSIAKTADTIDKNLGDTFQYTMVRLAEGAEKAAQKFEESALAAGNTAKYLGQSRVLISELEKYIDYISTRYKYHEN